MANGSSGFGVGDTAQQVTGMFGPLGKAIQMGSQVGEGATGGSDSGLVRGAGQLIFNPARNIDALGDDEISPAGKALGLLIPGAGELFRKSSGEPGVSREDPAQVERLLNLDRIAKNIQAGTDPATQAALQANQQNVAQTQAGIGKVTGGRSGATLNALLKAQAAGDQASNQALAQGQTRLPFFLNLGQQLQNRVEQRALEIDLLNRAQFKAEEAQAQKEANINQQGALGTAFATGGVEALAGQGQEGAGGIQQAFGGIFDRIQFGQNAGVTSDQIIDPNSVQAPQDVIAPISGGTEVTGATGFSFFG